MTSSETLDVIARRYACRAFQDTPVPPEILRAIAEAGVRSPSAVNRQPWRLTVISDRTAIDDIGRVGLENLKAADEAGYDRVMSRGGILLYNAPAMIIISTEPLDSDFPVALDAGIVTATVALAATSLGVDTCVAAMPGRAFQGANGQTLKAKYLPAGYDFAITVLLGYAAQAGTPHAPDFSKIAYL